MSLPSFTIDPLTHWYDIIEGITGSPLVGNALAESRVVFKSNMPADMFITYNGDGYRAITKMYADIGVDGTIKREGFAVALLANDSGLNIAGIQWSAEFLIPAPGRIQHITIGPFNAPSAGDVLDLSGVVPVPAGPITGPGGSTGGIDGGSL